MSIGLPWNQYKMRDIRGVRNPDKNAPWHMSAFDCTLNSVRFVVLGVRFEELTSSRQPPSVRFRRLNGGMLWRLLCCPTSGAKSRDVAPGRGVDGRRAADNVGCSPTAAASGSGPPGTPLSERTGLCFCLYCCVSTLVSGSKWPPGALREAPAWRTLSDPFPPSAPCTRADGAQLALAARTRASPQP